MTFQEILTKVTSFASLILNAGRIRTIEDETGRQYIGKTVYEQLPIGGQWEAVIMKIEWCPSCGLKGDWLLYIVYTAEDAPVVGAWVGREVLTLKDGE